MKGYGWQSAAAGGLGALAEILGQFRQTKLEREREERGLQERAAGRRQDMTELQLREAGSGARNIADNARAERVEKARIEAARVREENEEQRRRMAERDRRDAREDSQAFRLALEAVKEANRDGNQKPEKIRPTEKAAFAAKMLDAHESTGKSGAEFWDFLENLGAGEQDDAARLGMTQRDYLAEYNKRNRKRADAAAKAGKSGGNAFAPPPKKPAASPPPKSEKPSTKKKSYEDILG